MAFSFFWTTKPKGKITPLADPDMQTRVQKDGSRASAYVKNGKISESTFPDALTLYDSIRRGARVSNNGPMLGYRKNQLDGTMPYVWSSYKEVIDRSENIAHGFRALGLAAGQKTFIAIYSKNRPEWVIVENASYNHNNVSVPLYDTLGPEASSFILNQTEAKLVVCDVAEKVTEIIKMKPNCPSLKYVVIIEAITSILEEAAKKAGVIALTLDKLEKMGRDSKSKKEHEKPKPEDLATVCYTSGTTGTPKGVMLTHRNIIADCTTLNNFQSVPVRSDDVMMSFLPLAHMFERVVESAVYSVGARVGFFRGDLRLLPDDMKELSPTVLPVVPRLLNRLYDKVMTEISHSLIKKTIFNIAIAVKSRDLNNWVVRNDTFIDNLIFKKIRDGFGGKVRIMLTGSAPLAEDVLTFVRCAMGCVVVEGYGQTECVAAATVTLEGDPIPGHVGIPIPCNIIKLIDVPELDYYVKDNAGEVCVKGANVFKGYYKDEKLTSEALDKDGWLHTGDIGRWLKNGTLKIVDRKKHIFKLAQGEYVAPEKIEIIYTRSQYVAQIFVYGESLKSCLVGIVVPNPEVLPNAISSRFPNKSMEDLCKEPEIKKLIFDDLTKIGKKAGLCSFEQVKDIYLCGEMFSIENDLLTPTLKSKRPKLKERFKSEIEDMYKNLN